MAFKIGGYAITTSMATPTWGTVGASLEWAAVGIFITNISGTNKTIRCQIVKGDASGTFNIVPYDFEIPAGDRLNLISDAEGKLFLEATDQIQFQGTGTYTNGDCEVMMSYLEQSTS